MDVQTLQALMRAKGQGNILDGKTKMVFMIVCRICWYRLTQIVY